jgi:hypothetical protein
LPDFDTLLNTSFGCTAPVTVTFCAGKSMVYEITPADQQQSSRENQINIFKQHFLWELFENCFFFPFLLLRSTG